MFFRHQLCESSQQGQCLSDAVRIQPTVARSAQDPRHAHESTPAEILELTQICQAVDPQIMPPKVCLILGAGAGIGVHTARRFARGGYLACLARRSDQQGLDRAVQQIEDEGGQARGFLVDVSKGDTIETLVDTIARDVGEIDVAVYNVGAQFGHLPLMKTSPKIFERGWRLGCEGLFRLARACTPQMVERGHGTLLVTSATAAVRGNAGQAAHAGRHTAAQTCGLATRSAPGSACLPRAARAFARPHALP